MRAGSRGRIAGWGWWAGGAALLGVLLAVVAGGALLRPGAEVDGLAREAPRTTGYMRYRAALNGLPADTYRLRWTPLDSISPLLACAVVKAADRGFFRHHGFEWGQMRKSLARTLRSGAVAGGSTITQQTARNLFLGPERTFRRKAREAALATRLETGLPKRRILELYLNVIEWGDGVWGAEAASRHHFGKAAARLDAFEASFLASLVAAPLQPLTGSNAERAHRLQLRVLDQLYTSGLIDEDEWRVAVLRAEAVHDDLAAGVPLAAALRPRPGLPVYDLPAPFRDDPSRLLPSSALSEECGLARELSSTRTPVSFAP